MSSLKIREWSYVVNVFSVPEPYAFFNIMVRGHGYRLAPHSHEVYHINYVTEGSVEIITRDGSYTVGAGYAFVMPPGAEHELRSESGYVQIGMDVLNVQDKYGIVRKLHEISADKLLIVKVNEDNLKNRITEEMLCDMSPITELKCVTYMTRLVLDIIENAEKNKESDFAREFKLAAKAYDGSMPDLSELCKRLGFSKTHIERLTNREFGCSTVEYFARLRFSKICSLLTVTDKTLSAIAEECGFCDSAHLSLFFKKRSGMTCGEYRKLAK